MDLTRQMERMELYFHKMPLIFEKFKTQFRIFKQNFDIGIKKMYKIPRQEAVKIRSIVCEH